MASASYSEFALHVHKKCGDEEHADLYTIGVWEDSVLRGICHAQPIDAAVGAFRGFLHEAGKPVELTQG